MLSSADVDAKLRYVDANLPLLGLHSDLDFAVTSYELNVAKPDAEVFAEVAEQWSLDSAAPEPPPQGQQAAMLPPMVEEDQAVAQAILRPVEAAAAFERGEPRARALGAPHRHAEHLAPHGLGPGRHDERGQRGAVLLGRLQGLGRVPGWLDWLGRARGIACQLLPRQGAAFLSP